MLSAPQIVYIVHGINSEPAEANAWMNQLAARITAVLPAAQVRLHLWGFIGPLGWRFCNRVRRAHVRALQKAVAADRQAHPGAAIDFIGHSAGTWLGWHSMTQGGAPRAFYRRLILMGSIVSTRETFEREGNHFGGLLNLYSREDEVVACSTFGQSGWQGFQNPQKDPRVRNVDVSPYEHTDYERPGPAWDAAAGFLAAA